MTHFLSIRSAAIVLLLANGISPALAGQSVHVGSPAASQARAFRMGSATSRDGSTLTFDSRSFIRNGRRWTPVMAEFHYSRLPDSEWREELLKMKAGGIDIVATYVFWIHHEEIEGRWDWSGCRDLRKFVQLCDEAGLKVIVRCGPWCHGEVRNGGHPDWLLKKGWKRRSDDPPYLEKTKILYQQIAEQVRGLLWKDGGPVIGIQFENEYTGPATHLLNLKKLGYDAGLDVPIYTRTGWNSPSGSMPFGEVIPLYGVYAEGFWDRSIQPMPAGYWKGFVFSTNRVDDAELVGAPGLGGKMDPPDASLYPYLTCEIGGGMMSSYHRRILGLPEEAEALTLVRIGDGSVMPGYYMYHGGENPDGELSTLQESQATGMWNDLPVKNYDFQAPLGQYNQIRPHYHRLRRLHLFLQDWGESLAGMDVTLPAPLPTVKGDTNTVRWCVRSDGQGGFVFVNNFERLQPMPAKPGVQFTVNLPSGAAILPVKPVTIPANACFLWPFNFDLGLGVKLLSATAQPICAVEDGGIRTVFFAQTKGVPTEFVFEKGASIKSASGKVTESGGRRIVSSVTPGTRAALEIITKEGTLQIVLLSDEASLALWKGRWHGRDRVFLTKAGLVLDGNNLRLTSDDPEEMTVGIFPAPAEMACNREPLRAQADGVFKRFAPAKPKAVSLKPAFELVRAAGPVRDIPLGKIEQPVPAAPEDADFDKAAVWSIKLPEKIDMGVDPILRLNYVGDVARVTLNGKLLGDDFYNGNAFDVGLRRYAPDILSGTLRVSILPLRKDAPIYLAKSAKPDFGNAGSLAELREATIVPRYTIRLSSDALSESFSAQK